MLTAIGRRGIVAERWSPMLFLVGGGLLVGHAGVQAIKTFTGLTPPPDVFVATGHLVALAGLVGLYPALVDGTPRVAQAGAVVAAVPLAGWAVMTVTKFLAVFGVVSALTDVLPGAVILLVVGTTLVTYVLFGVATLLAGGSSRTVGFLVLAPAALIAVLLAGSAVPGVSPLVGVGIGVGLALSYLALGYRLTRWDPRTAHPASGGDATVG